MRPRVAIDPRRILSLVPKLEVLDNKRVRPDLPKPVYLEMLRKRREEAGSGRDERDTRGSQKLASTSQRLATNPESQAKEKRDPAAAATGKAAGAAAAGGGARSETKRTQGADLEERPSKRDAAAPAPAEEDITHKKKRRRRADEGDTALRAERAAGSKEEAEARDFSSHPLAKKVHLPAAEVDQPEEEDLAMAAKRSGVVTVEVNKEAAAGASSPEHRPSHQGCN